jgi:hypothetical protein
MTEAATTLTRAAPQAYVGAIEQLQQKRPIVSTRVRPGKGPTPVAATALLFELQQIVDGFARALVQVRCAAT